MTPDTDTATDTDNLPAGSLAWCANLRSAAAKLDVWLDGTIGTWGAVLEELGGRPLLGDTTWLRGGTVAVLSGSLPPAGPTDDATDAPPDADVFIKLNGGLEDVCWPCGGGPAGGGKKEQG